MVNNPPDNCQFGNPLVSTPDNRCIIAYTLQSHQPGGQEDGELNIGSHVYIHVETTPVKSADPSLTIIS